MKLQKEILMRPFIYQSSLARENIFSNHSKSCWEPIYCLGWFYSIMRYKMKL